MIWFPHPMGHGMGNDHVLEYTVLATEIDNLSLAEQWKIVQWLGSVGLPPTSVVFSGNKSLHIIWRLKTRLGLDRTEDYLKAQKALCILVNGDTNLAIKALKLRLPGCYRPGKKYPQQLIYNTGNSTTVEDVLEVFKQVYGRDITDTLWDTYKQSLSGRIELSPSQVLVTPDEVLKPKTVARTAFKATSTRTTNLGEEIEKIDASVTPEDFTQFGITLAKKTTRHQFVITPQSKKGTSNYIYTGKDGTVLLHSQGGDIFPNGKSTINYSTLWKHERGYAHSGFKEYAKAFLEAHNVYIDDATTTTTTEAKRTKKHRAKTTSSAIPVTEGNRTTFTARYMPSGITNVVPEGTKVVGMMADCGTGKTTAIKELLLQNPDDYVITLTPLQSLARSNAIKLDIYYKDEYSVGCKHISMCLHNLYDGSAVGSQLLPRLRRHTGKVHLVLDEAECLRTGLLALDSTLAKNQLAIIDAIGEIGNLEGATVWLLDKDLKPSTIDFYSDCIRQYAGLEAITPVPHHWIINEYQNKLSKVVHYPQKNIEAKNTTPAIMLKHALRAGKDDGMVLVVVTGQCNNNTTGKYSAEAAANYFRDNGYDGRVLVVDSETSAVEGSLEANIISNPSSGLRTAYDKGYKFIIFTLGIFKTGISIEDNPDGGNLPALFNSVFIASTGLLSPELVVQSLFRYRNLDVTRYLFTPATGFNYLAKKAMDTVTAESTLNQSEIYKLHSRTLDIACPNRSPSKIRWLLDQWAGVVVAHNQSMADYAGAVGELLYDVADEISGTELDENGFNELLDTGAEVKAALVEIKDGLALVNAIATTEATTITDATALKLKEQNKRTKEQNQQLQKWRVQKVTGRTEIDVEDVFNYNSDSLSPSRLLHNATNSYPLLHTLDKIDLLEITDGNPIRQAKKIRQLNATIVRMLLGQGLQDVLDAGEVTKDSTEVTTLITNLVDTGLLAQHQKTNKKGEVSTYYSGQGQLAELAGKKVYRFTTDVVKDLLKVVGATLVMAGVDQCGGKKVRTYKVMSAWVNTAGQCTRRLFEVNNELHSHWLMNDLCTVATHLEGRKIDRTQIVEFINALLRQKVVDEDYMPLLEVARNNLIRHHFVS
jgi:hypothetical protein